LSDTNIGVFEKQTAGILHRGGNKKVPLSEDFKFHLRNFRTYFFFLAAFFLGAAFFFAAFFLVAILLEFNV
jgi:hypothetical protein